MKGAIQQDATRRPALQRTSNARQRTRAFAVAANAAKYVLLAVAGIALFERARPFAFEQRGYEAIGGEVFLLALPLVWFGIESMIRGMVTMARELWRGGGHE